MLKVSVVIPNWNGKNFLTTALKSLEDQSFKDFEVIIVDNGSKDGSVEFIKKEFSNFKVVSLEKNIGFAPAVNLGIKVSRGEYIVLINNDTKVGRDCLKYLVLAADRHPEVGMVAAKMLNFYNPNILDSAGDYIDAVGHANNIGLGENDGEKFNKAGYVFLVTGGGGLFKREALLKVGLLDEDYFAYFEDVDWCFRAQFLGFQGWYEPKAVIHHIHKATSGRNKSFTEYLQFRNMTVTIIKNFPRSLLLKDLNWLKILLVNINTIRFLATKGYFWEALRAEFFVLLKLPKLLRQRMEIQSRRIVPDRYIIDNVLPKKVTLFGLLKPGF